jgi:hypothetical protein
MERLLGNPAGSIINYQGFTILRGAETGGSLLNRYG